MNNDHVFDKSNIFSFYRIKYFKININRYKCECVGSCVCWMPNDPSGISCSRWYIVLEHFVAVKCLSPISIYDDSFYCSHVGLLVFGCVSYGPSFHLSHNLFCFIVNAKSLIPNLYWSDDLFLILHSLESITWTITFTKRFSLLESFFFFLQEAHKPSVMDHYYDPIFQSLRFEHSITREKSHKYTDFCHYKFLTPGMFFLLIFALRIIALQGCVGFCYTTAWISHQYTCIPFFRAALLVCIPPSLQVIRAQSCYLLCTTASCCCCC